MLTRAFLKADIVFPGLSVNIPSFSHNGILNESDIKLSKTIAQCRIHEERAESFNFKGVAFINLSKCLLTKPVCTVNVD